LHELQLFALSESLPHLSHYFYDVYRYASPFFHAKYILGRVFEHNSEATCAGIYTRALRYPICDEKVLQAINSFLKDVPQGTMCVQLSRRLFRNLSPPENGWTANDHPIPLLRYLYQASDIPPVNTDSNDGYALTRAVHARFLPLVKFLLQHHASPKCHDGLAVKVAIRQRDLDMVKTLVERRDSKHDGGKKKRKFEDRITLDSRMLKVAVMSDAKDIVEYLCKEKKVTPDMQTLKKLG